MLGIEWLLTIELWPLQVWCWSAGLPSTMTTSSRLFLLVTTESASPASFEGVWWTIVTQVTLTLSSRKCVYWDVAAWLPVSYGLYCTQPQGHCPKGEGLYQPSSDCDTVCVWVHARCYIVKEHLSDSRWWTSLVCLQVPSKIRVQSLQTLSALSSC